MLKVFRKIVLLSTISLITMSSSYAMFPEFPLTFPRDHGTHAEKTPYATQNLFEWWYGNGDLYTTNGRHFGFAMTYAFNTLDFSGNKLHVPMLIFQLTDIDNNKVYGNEVLFSPTPNTYSAEDLDLTLDADNTIKRIGQDYILHAKIVSKDGKELKISFVLSSDNSRILVNRTGYVPQWESYYYSLPHLKTAGDLQIDGQQLTIDRKKSISWLDHQWSDHMMDSQDQWTWFGIQLKNGVTVNVGVIVDPVTKLPVPYKVLATVRTADGHEIVSPDVTLTNFLPVGNTYPDYYQLSIPSADLRLEIHNLAQNQNVNTIWEGLCDVKGYYKHKPITGMAYVENTIKN